MKYKITDLMDLYADPVFPPDPAEGASRLHSDKEANQVKQTKHKFSWREGLATAAALAIIILGGFGLKGLLQKGVNPIQGTEVSQAQHESNDLSWSHVEELSGEEKAEYSRFLSVFAEQSINSMQDLDEDAELIRFAFIYRRVYDPESINVQKDGDTLWDTLTPEQINETLSKLLGRTVTPKDGADYSILRSDPVGGHCSFHDGCFWQEPSGKDFLPRFALATGIVRDFAPESVNFEVYAVQIYAWVDWDLRAFPSMTPEQILELENEGKIVKLQAGSAEIRNAANELQLVEYSTSDIDNLKLSDVYPLVNPLLTAFAQQGIRNTETDLAGEYELASFAHIYAKVNNRDLIVYQSVGDETFETMTLDRVNGILNKLMGKTISPAEGTDYTVQRGDNCAQHETFHDGCFWWPAAEGDPHTAFAIGRILTGNARSVNGSAELTLAFNVYEFSDPGGNDMAALKQLTVEEAQAQVKAGTLTHIADGQARVRYQYGMLTLLKYELIDRSANTDVSKDSEEDLHVDLRETLTPLFDNPDSWYARAILGRFAEPEQVDLFQMFYTGFHNAYDETYLQQMEAFYARDPEARQFQTGCDVMSTDEIDQVLQQYLGVNLSQTTKKGLFNFSYLEDTDCYYHFHGDTNIAGCTIREIRVQEDGTILFTHAPLNWPYPSTEVVPLWTTALKRVDGRYVILSNLPGEWVTGEDVEALSFLFDGTSSWRTETTDGSGTAAVRELSIRENGSIIFREGDRDSEFSCWQCGGWSVENGNTLVLELWEIDENENRKGEPYVASFTCEQEDGTGNLILTQTSERGFETDEAGTRLVFHVLEWNSDLE